MRLHLDMHNRFGHERTDREVAAAVERHRVIRPSGSLRRRLGHAIMAIGSRLAAEPSLELVRPR
jgi:hypothetical protein